ncbi:glycosyltransferase family 4 protein [Ectopseudomonas composti]
MTGLLITSFFVFGASFLMTMFYRNFALNRSLLDIPNARSSHLVPTPRGGGVAIVLSFLLVTPLGLWILLGYVPIEYLAILLVGSWFAVIGWMDDVGIFVSTFPRLAAQFLGAGGALWAVSGVPQLEVFGLSVGSGWLSGLVGVLYLVWLTNLYNFMDGINGIASLEALSVCLGLLLVICVTGVVMDFTCVLIFLAAAAAGFVLWNFPVARIFMGDSGSYFIGSVLGVFSLLIGQVRADLFWCFILMLGVFVTDATTTLLVRVYRGERPHEAHRQHAYQHAAHKLGSHAKVAFAVFLINILWLLPIALSLAVGFLNAGVALFIGYAPLVVLAFYWNAGFQVRILGRPVS